MTSTTKTVHLILTGASGYLGQHLLSHWIREGVIQDESSVQFYITALYHKSETFPNAVEAFRQSNQPHTSILDVVVSSIDLTNPSPDDIKSLLQFSDVSSVIVVHSAALSSPRACQADPETARVINILKKFLDALLEAPTTACFLVDQSDLSTSALSGMVLQ